LEVEPQVTSGDYLEGFLLGTRKALYDNKRESVTVTITEVGPESVGMLIALFERAVGLYASLINVNAYHQPGVEAGKKAASDVISLQIEILKKLNAQPRIKLTLADLARATNGDEETIYKICEHLAVNGRLEKTGTGPANAAYQVA